MLVLLWVPSGHEHLRTLALFQGGPSLFISGLNSVSTFLRGRSGTPEPRLSPPSKTFPQRPPPGALMKPQLGLGPRPGSGLWGRGQLPGALRCDISPAVVQCAKPTGWRGAGKRLPEGGNKTARSRAQPATASRSAVTRAPPSSCQVSAPPRRPPRVPAAARYPSVWDAPCAYWSFASCRSPVACRKSL